MAVLQELWRSVVNNDAVAVRFIPTPAAMAQVDAMYPVYAAKPMWNWLK